MTTQTAQEKWHLRHVADVNVDGREYVVYSDGHGTYAIDRADWLRPTAEDDYSLWCAGTTGVGDHGLCARIALAAGLDGIRSCGDDSYVDAAAG